MVPTSVLGSSLFMHGSVWPVLMRPPLRPMGLEAFLPALRLVSWHADHCWTADLRQRADKRAALRSLLAKHKPEVFFLQQAGGVHFRALEEKWRRQGFEVFASTHAAGSAGVLALVQRPLLGPTDWFLPFFRKVTSWLYVLPSCILLRCSTLLLSVWLAQRKLQYRLLSNLLGSSPRALLFAGNQNRVDCADGGWLFGANPEWAAWNFTAAPAQLVRASRQHAPLHPSRRGVVSVDVNRVLPPGEPVLSSGTFLNEQY